MKNSKLLLYTIIALFALFIISTLPGILIIFGGIALLAYVIACLMDIGDTEYIRIIHSKYNFIEKFINWIDGMPQIIKKKDNASRIE